MKKLIDRTALAALLGKKYRALPEEKRTIVLSDIMALYDEFEHFADREFNNALLSDDDAQFQQRYWEMLLAHHLTNAGHKLSRKRSGPDFGFELDGKKIWIEAVAPQGSDDIDLYYRNEVLNGGGWFSADIFHLRWTQAIDEKVSKFATYLKKGWVGANDICVIAVNSALLGSSGMTGKSDYPALIDVVFGVGPEFVTIDRGSMEVVDQGYRREPVIMKKENPKEIPVAKCFFLEKDVSHISAIMASSETPRGWSPRIAVYNPLARNPLSRGKIGAEYEYYAEDCGDHFEVKTVRQGC